MIRTSALGRTWFAATALVVVIAIVIQAVLAARGAPYSVFDTAVERVANILAFFTILSNLLVGGTCLALAIRRSPPARLLRVLYLDAVLGIAVTGIVYNLVLAPLYDLSGWSWFANLLLHVVVPIMAVLGWLLFGPRGLVDTPTVLLATIYPIAWLAFTLIRGAVVDWSPFPAWYPYPFVDAGQLGYARVTLNCLVIAVLFLGLAFGAKALDRFLQRRFADAPQTQDPQTQDSQPQDPQPQGNAGA